jgi:hypothetical protein
MPISAKEQAPRRNTVMGGAAHIHQPHVHRNTVNSERAHIADLVGRLGAQDTYALSAFLSKAIEGRKGEIRDALLTQCPKLPNRHYAQVWQMPEWPGTPEYELEIEKAVRRALLTALNLQRKAWAQFFETVRENGRDPAGIWRIQCFERAEAIVDCDGKPLVMHSGPQKQSHNIFLLPKSPDDDDVPFLHGKKCIDYLASAETGSQDLEVQKDDVILFLP